MSPQASEDTEAPHPRATAVLFGHASAEAALLLYAHGFTVEAAPVVRNVVNHAYALHWLVDNGPLAVDASSVAEHGAHAELTARSRALPLRALLC